MFHSRVRGRARTEAHDHQSVPDRKYFFDKAIDDDAQCSVMRFSRNFLLPSTTLNVRARANYERLAGVLASFDGPRVLVIGGRVRGEGMQPIFALGPTIRLIQTDIALGPETEIVCDAHRLPFANNSIDCVIIQAVLEHVFDPWCCVQEVHRVLKTSGLVYAETPFMQQVHLGCYDFTRFTHLGHRRLFRRFQEIDSGPTAGPATVLAWSWRYFLASLSANPRLSTLLEIFARFTALPLIQCDRFLVNRPAAYDASSAYYFFGRRSDKVFSDDDLVRSYRGTQKNHGVTNSS